MGISWWSDWWFGTCFIFPYIGKNHPIWRTHIFQRVETTNQKVTGVNHPSYGWLWNYDLERLSIESHGGSPISENLHAILKHVETRLLVWPAWPERESNICCGLPRYVNILRLGKHWAAVSKFSQGYGQHWQTQQGFLSSSNLSGARLCQALNKCVFSRKKRQSFDGNWLVVFHFFE